MSTTALVPQPVPAVARYGWHLYFYTKTKSVPHSKHTPYRLYKPVS